MQFSGIKINAGYTQKNDRINNGINTITSVKNEDIKLSNSALAGLFNRLYVCTVKYE